MLFSSGQAIFHSTWLSVFLSSYIILAVYGVITQKDPYSFRLAAIGLLFYPNIYFAGG
jgi:hypothetical protein